MDRHLGQFDRVRHCRQQDFSEQEAAYVLGCSRALVAEYRSIDEQLREEKKQGQQPEEEK